jgi:hypothetical protein
VNRTWTVSLLSEAPKHPPQQGLRQSVSSHQGLDEEIRELSKVMGEDVDQLSMEILEPASPAETPCESEAPSIAPSIAAYAPNRSGTDAGEGNM